MSSRTLWKIGVFTFMAFPAVLLAYWWSLLLQGQPAPALGVNPVQKTVLESGVFSMRALIFALAVSPLATLLRRPQILSVRRMLGLFAFFYASLHGLAYIGLDQLFSLTTLWEDLLKRWPISVGMIGWLLLLPLAITSTRGMIKRLGAKNWKRLHKLVFAVAVAASIHNILITKGMQIEPLVHASLLALLVMYRVAGRPRFPKLSPAT
ncbi:MAG: sulfite oxidase heme-binding subunit YedZ [Sphingomonadales bacterium]